MKGLYTDAEMKSDNVKVGWERHTLTLTNGCFVSGVPGVCRREGSVTLWAAVRPSHSVSFFPPTAHRADFIH